MVDMYDNAYHAYNSTVAGSCAAKVVALTCKYLPQEKHSPCEFKTGWVLRDLLHKRTLLSAVCGSSPLKTTPAPVETITDIQSRASLHRVIGRLLASSRRVRTGFPLHRCGGTGFGGIFRICLMRNSRSSMNCSSSVRSSKKCERKFNSFSRFIRRIF